MCRITSFFFFLNEEFTKRSNNFSRLNFPSSLNFFIPSLTRSRFDMISDIIVIFCNLFLLIFYGSLMSHVSVDLISFWSV